MSFCEHCISGVRHEGTPTGVIEIIGGVKCYVATPEGDYPKDKAILYLTDVFGIDLPNHQLQADDFAKNGFKVYIIDYLHGDPIPADVLPEQKDGRVQDLSNRAVKFDLQAWMVNHGTDKTRPPLDSVIAALKAQGVTKFGATGYCFAARYIFDLSFDDVIQAAVVSHPSFLDLPKDLECFAKTNVPLLINTADNDSLFPLEANATADEILGNGKFAPGYQRTFWPGNVHGFAVRGDLSNPKVKAAKEGSFKATVEWFMKHL